MNDPGHRHDDPSSTTPTRRGSKDAITLQTSSRRAGGAFPTGSLAPLAHALFLGGAAAAVFLAGKPQEGALGVFLVCAGLAMIVCPPRVRVEWRLWLVAVAVVGCASLALLPEHFLPVPAWRRTLDALPAVAMPGTISTTPTLTVFWLAVLAISLLAGLFLLAQPIRSRWLLGFALTGALAAGVYAALAIYAKQTGWHYAFASDATFGFLPNRNHTATFLFVGSLLALGALGVVLREERWFAALLAGAAVTVCGAGLVFFSPSRGGIVFLGVGVILWIAGLGRRHRDTRLVVSFAAVGLAVGVLFLLSGGEVRDRLLGRKVAPASVIPAAVPAAGGDVADAMTNVSTDFRLKIYRDTLDVIRDFPLTGIGLGGFPLVFSQYRRASLSESSAIHPESDWLMFVAETGIPASLCALALIVMVAARLRPERDHPYWPLRWGCAVAAGAAALHGMVDVPLHRVQLGWWVLAVAGLALQSGRGGLPGRSRWQWAFFVGGGLAALTLGTALVRAEWFGGPPLPPFVAARADADIRAAFNRHDVDGATDIARAAVRRSPMVPALYYQFGTMLLHSEDTDAEVDRVFAAQRQLNPSWPVVPFQQGVAWISVDPNRTVSLWMEALERHRRIERAAGGTPGDDGVTYYRQLLERGRPFPAVHQALGGVAARSPAYALAWLEGPVPRISPPDWDRLTGAPEFLRGFSEGERGRFLLLWFQKGDRAALGRFVDAHPDWQAAAWPVHLRQLLEARQFEAAVRESAAHYHVSLDLPSPDAAVASTETSAQRDETLVAFERYWRDGNTVAAHRVLDEAAAVAGTVPLASECWRLRAAFAAQDRAWDRAWDSLEHYLQQTHPAEPLR